MQPGQRLRRRVSRLGKKWDDATKTIVAGTGSDGRRAQGPAGRLSGRRPTTETARPLSIADLNTHLGLEGDALADGLIRGMALKAKVDTNLLRRRGVTARAGC